MKGKKKIIKQNTAIINDFMGWEGKRTKKEMSAFLFELQGSYLSQPGAAWTDEYSADITFRFGLLYRLVNDLQVVEKES